MKNILFCAKCNKNIEGIITHKGCTNCGSTSISKRGIGNSDKAWLDWWYGFAKYEARKLHKQRGK